MLELSYSHLSIDVYLVTDCVEPVLCIKLFPCRYMITTQKASGVISGIQRSENGEIEWKTELPRTCLLSPYVSNRVNHTDK
jgi:hypothetical protein